MSRKLVLFTSKMIKKNKISVPRAPKKVLNEIASVSREIEKKGIPDHLVIKKLKKNLGKGVFLHPKSPPIPKGAVIAPYAGKLYVNPQNDEGDSDYVFTLISDLLLTREEQKIYSPTRPYHPRRLYSLELDAEKMGNFTRFINHSEKPNIEADLYQIPANSLGLSSGFEIIYLAKKTIHPGEQLLISYEGEGKSYWGVLGIKPFFMTPKTFRLDASLKVVSYE